MSSMKTYQKQSFACWRYFCVITIRAVYRISSYFLYCSNTHHTHPRWTLYIWSIRMRQPTGNRVYTYRWHCLNIHTWFNTVCRKTYFLIRTHLESILDFCHLSITRWLLRFTLVKQKCNWYSFTRKLHKTRISLRKILK